LINCYLFYTAFAAFSLLFYVSLFLVNLRLRLANGYVISVLMLNTWWFGDHDVAWLCMLSDAAITVAMLLMVWYGMVRYGTVRYENCLFAGWSLWL